MPLSRLPDPSVLGAPSGAPVLLALPRRWKLRILLVLFLLPAGLVLLGLGGKLLLGSPGGAQAGGICVLAGLGALVLLVWRYRVEAARRAGLSELGLELAASGGNSLIRYEQVQEIWFSVRRIQAGGLLGLALVALIDRLRRDKALNERWLTIQLRVVGGGTTIRLNDQDRGVLAAHQELLRRVNPRLLHEARQRIDSGAVVAFNKVTLSREGLAMGNRKRVRLDQIEQVSIKAGTLCVKVKDTWFKSGQRVARIPNLYVLTELLAQMSDGTLAMDVPMGLNLAFRFSL